MNKTYSLGRWYVSIAPQADGSPLIDHAFTVEHDGLKRRGEGYLIRLPFTGHRPTHGLSLGRWKEQPDQREPRKSECGHYDCDSEDCYGK